MDTTEQFNPKYFNGYAKIPNVYLKGCCMSWFAFVASKKVKCFPVDMFCDNVVLTGSTDYLNPSSFVARSQA